MNIKNAGFTLIELLVAISVAAVLLAVAVPFMGTFTANNTAREAAALLELDLMYARNTAVTRNLSVGLVPVDDEFENGWRVSVFRGTTETELLRQRNALDDKVDVTAAAYDSSTPVLFNNRGALSNGGTISVCTSGSIGDVDARIELLPSGQITFRSVSC